METNYTNTLPDTCDAPSLSQQESSMRQLANLVRREYNAIRADHARWRIPMKSKSPNDRITRRRFLELGSVASAGILASSNAARPASNLRQPDAAENNSAPIIGKIALEEHFSMPETIGESYAALREDWRLKILDMGDGRIAEMDRGGVEICILSLTTPGIQGIPNVSQAVDLSRRANDYLAAHMSKFPKRLKGFAALPMQDPQAAAQELTRCVKELGFCGALVNGFSQVGVADSAVYYDLPQYRPFWAAVEQLGVPFYLHPRAPLESRQQVYNGHPWFVSSAWGFQAETSIHALRLMASGLFDEYPKLQLILGHLGEALPFCMWRVDHRLSKQAVPPKSKLPLAQYLRESFYITTSGNFREQALADVMFEVGADRILYSVDYPFEDMTEAAGWFDSVSISETDRVKIGRTNAQKLFRL